MSFTRGSPFRLYLQRSSLFEEHHPHKFISDLHFIDIFMDPYVDVTGERGCEQIENFFFLFHHRSEQTKKLIKRITLRFTAVRAEIF